MFAGQESKRNWGKRLEKLPKIGSIMHAYPSFLLPGAPEGMRSWG